MILEGWLFWTVHIAGYTIESGYQSSTVSSVNCFCKSDLRSNFQTFETVAVWSAYNSFEVASSANHDTICVTIISKTFKTFLKLQVFLFYFRWSPTNVTCCAKMWKGSPPTNLVRVEIERDPPRNLSHPHHHQRPFPQLWHNRLLQTPPTTQWDTVYRSPPLLATCSFSAITITARPQTQQALQAKVTTKSSK